MNRLLPRKRQSSRLQDQLSTDLFNAREPSNSLSVGFTPRLKLEKIWSKKQVKEFFHHKNGKPLPPGSTNTIRQHFLQTISILVYIEWDHWSHFERIFLAHQGSEGCHDRRDCRIPDYDIEILKTFLDTKAAMKFFDARYIFCPVDIVHGGDVKISGRWSLPFLTESGDTTVCGKGGFSTVNRQVIATRHFVSGRLRSSENKEVAQKVFNSRPDFEREYGILDYLRRCDNKNKRIVLPLATITAGTDCSILFPLATMDLEKFLGGKLLQPEECDMGHLLDEIGGLASALAYLHTGLEYGVQGYHTDLKPANILVFAEPGCDGVGVWKITDFGLSIIKRQQFRDTLGVNEVRNSHTTITQLQQIRGAYQAPEVCSGSQISRRSDVWSLGCILVRVLCFQLDGVQGLRELDDLRHKDYDNDYFARGKHPTILNPHIEEWIRNLPLQHGRHCCPDFLRGCTEILLMMLSIPIHERPDAHTVMTLLSHLKSLYGRARASISSRGTGRSHFSIGTTPPGSSPSDTPPLTPKSNPPRDPDLDAELAAAVERGDTLTVKDLLTQNVDVNARFENGKTPLMIAVHKGHTEIASWLLSSGADCRAYSDEGYTCLHYAAWPAADVELLLSLIHYFEEEDQTVDIPMNRFNEETPLMTLVRSYVDDNRWEQKCRALIHAGANIKYADTSGNTPLSCAIEDHATRAKKVLLAYGSAGDDSSQKSRRWSRSLHRKRTNQS